MGIAQICRSKGVKRQGASLLHYAAMISYSMLSPRLPSSNACSLNKRKEKKNTRKIKNMFYPSDTQDGCSKLQIIKKKIKHVVLKCSYEV